MDIIDETIICGSKRYHNLNIDSIVDSFHTIVRNNMLVSHSGYGNRESNIQVLNIHVYDSFQSKMKDPKQWFKKYKHKKIDIEHIKKFVKYINSNKTTKYVYYLNNNTDLMMEILTKNNINISLDKQIRCGLSHVAESIKNNEKPFLIGFSLKKEENYSHIYNNSDNISISHDVDKEIDIIKYLHEKKLIDASLCCIKDEKSIELDETVIQPTEYIVEYLKSIEVK